MSSGMAQAYGAGPYFESPRIMDPVTVPAATPFFPLPDGDIVKAIREAAEKLTKPVDAPPSYAADPELAAIAAFVKLDDEAQRRVMRFLVSRYGVPQP